MPAYTKPNIGRLLLTFSRDGEEPEQQVAPTGLAAVSMAMRMLSLKEELLAGDRLTVETNGSAP
jgi:hypothetical protein